eukprot:6687568-Prymnesium_polylepis.3
MGVRVGQGTERVPARGGEQPVLERELSRCSDQTLNNVVGIVVGLGEALLLQFPIQRFKRPTSKARCRVCVPDNTLFRRRNAPPTSQLALLLAERNEFTPCSVHPCELLPPVERAACMVLRAWCRFEGRGSAPTVLCVHGNEGEKSLLNARESL